jgi:hypothetical protein
VALPFLGPFRLPAPHSGDLQHIQKNGKTLWCFTYPREGHVFREREHRLDAWRKQEAFLRKYLQPAHGQSITSTDHVLFTDK